MKQRIYLITLGADRRLVRASHPNVALMHIVREIASVEVADQEALVDLLGEGIKVESIEQADVKAESASGTDSGADAGQATEPAEQTTVSQNGPGPYVHDVSTTAKGRQRAKRAATADR